MSAYKLSVESLFDGENFIKNATVFIQDNKIKSIEKTIEKNITKGILVAGFIDLQVNGGGNFLFNQTPDLYTINQIGKTHQQFGTTAWLPTLVTDSIEKMQQAADSIASAINKKTPGVLGIHFEGPHLSKAKKGIHQAKLIRPISEQELDIFTRQDLGKVMVTLAPENVSTETIQFLSSQGVIVCLGHSNASYQQTKLALQAGAKGFTHLFNAMSPLTSREPGMIGAALEDQTSWCGIIVDGIHIHPASAKIALKAKERMFLVTDAMPPVGCNETTFNFFGQKIYREGLKLTTEQGNLAGSTLDMATAVKNSVEMLNCPLERALNMASINPAKLLGIDKQYGSLTAGKRASMVLLDDKLAVKSVWIDGKQHI